MEVQPVIRVETFRTWMVAAVAIGLLLASGSARAWYTSDWRKRGSVCDPCGDLPPDLSIFCEIPVYPPHCEGEDKISPHQRACHDVKEYKIHIKVEEEETAKAEAAADKAPPGSEESFQAQEEARKLATLKADLAAATKACQAGANGGRDL
jgi:hypothetical protein